MSRTCVDDTSTPSAAAIPTFGTFVPDLSRSNSPKNSQEPGKISSVPPIDAAADQATKATTPRIGP
jgi:hypothetical protein